MLVCIKTSKDVRCFVKYRRPGKRDHDKGENISERKAENRARDDKSEGRESANSEDRGEPREIGPRDKHGHRQSAEKPERHDPGFEDNGRVTPCSGRYIEQRAETTRLATD